MRLEDKARQIGQRQMTEYSSKYEPLLQSAYSRALGQNQEAQRMLRDRTMATMMQGGMPTDVQGLSAPQRELLLANAVTGARTRGDAAARQVKMSDLMETMGRGTERKHMARQGMMGLLGIEQRDDEFSQWYNQQKKAMKDAQYKRYINKFMDAITMGFSKGARQAQGMMGGES